MKLGVYLSETDTTNGALAKALGVSEEAVRLWVTGQRKPRQEQMARLYKHTGGKVTANDFYHAEPAA